MKYMGSKSAMLAGGLGDLIDAELPGASRFVDLFSGSGAVSTFVAENYDVPVLSVDLQEYARVLTGAVIARTRILRGQSLAEGWIARAKRGYEHTLAQLGDSAPLDDCALTAEAVARDRQAADALSLGFIAHHYGGHYFSLLQAVAFDQLYQALPDREPHRTVCLAALIQSASRCAASPGHTAQPFQPTSSLLPYIGLAWRRDPFVEAYTHLREISWRHARVRGRSVRDEASRVAAKLAPGDLVFCDPPYSAVQYSRFYHVLEGVARGGWAEVSGTGRAPQSSDRATSEFSLKSKAAVAMDELLRRLHSRQCRVMITFPDAEASNGLSAERITERAKNAWAIETHYVESSHSTLGGPSGGAARGARRSVKEAVLLLSPLSGGRR